MFTKDSTSNAHQKPTQLVIMPLLAAISEGSMLEGSPPAVPSLVDAQNKIVMAAQSARRDAMNSANLAIKSSNQDTIESEPRKEAAFSSHLEEHKSAFSEKPKRKQKLNRFTNKLVGGLFSPRGHQVAKSEDIKAKDTVVGWLGRMVKSLFSKRDRKVTSIGEGKENEKLNEEEPAEREPDGSLKGLRRTIFLIQKEAKLVQLEKNQRDRIDMARKHRWQARELLERAGKAADNRDRVEAGYLTADAYAYAEESKRHVGKAKEAEAKRFDLEKRGIHDFQVSNRGWLENPAKLSKTRCGLALSSSVSSSEDDSSFRKWVKREDTKHRLKHVSLWPCSFNFDEACKGDEPSLYMKTREILNILSAEERVQPMGSWTSTPQDNGTMASSICSSVNDATYAQNTTGGQKEEPTTLLHLLDLNDKLACGIIQSFGNVQREEKTYESARFVKQWNNKNNFEQGSQSSFQDSHAESRGEITMDDERNTLLDIRALPESNDILDDDDDAATECIVANPDWTMTCAPRLKSPVFLSSESQETATSTFDPYYNTCGATATTPEKRDEERDESTEVIPQQDGSMAFVSHQDTRSLAFLGPQPRPKPKIALRLYKYCQKGKQLFSCDAPTVVSTRYSERLFLQESDISDNSMVAEWNYKR